MRQHKVLRSVTSLTDRPTNQPTNLKADISGIIGKLYFKKTEDHSGKAGPNFSQIRTDIPTDRQK